jgi:outer membrane immunogenic protein
MRVGTVLKMMRKHWNLLITVAPLALVLGAPALGADMAVNAPLYKAPPPAPYSWTGLYIGANAGYGVGSQQGNLTFAPNGGLPITETFNAMPAGGFGGGQLGYNYQFKSIVLGLETDIQGSGISDTRTCLLTCTPAGTGLIDQKLNWFGTTRARLGLATGPVLSYVTVGAAYGEVETGVSTTLAGIPTSSMTASSTKAGWTWGTGVEAALGGNWTAKAEYLYIDFGSSSAANSLVAGGALQATSFTTKNQEQIFRGGVNYRFGPDQSAASWQRQNWAGLFVGGTFGYGIGRDDSAIAPLPLTGEAFYLSPRGFNGGAIAGYNWQFGSWVAGVETDIQDSSGSGYLTCVFGCSSAAGPIALTIDQDLSWFGTVRGRLGYAAGPALFYATGGAAYGSVKENVTQTATGVANFGQSFTHSKSGFAVGGGIENKLDVFGWLGPNWTTRTEYLYMDLGSVSDSFVNAAVLPGVTQTLTSNLHEQIWRTVVTYKFTPL